MAVEAQLANRIKFWKIAFGGIGGKVIISIWLSLQVLSFIRTEFFPEYDAKYPLIALIPQLPLSAWIITLLLMVLGVFLEGGYHLYLQQETENERLQCMLTNLQTPALSLDFLSDDTRYIAREGGERGVRKTVALVSVTNPSAETIEEIEVSCEDFIPVEFGQDNLPLALSGATHLFTLHPGQREFIKAVALVKDDSTRPGIFEILLRCPLAHRNGFQSDGMEARAFSMKIRARGRNVSEARMILKFGYKDDKFFACKRD